MTIRSAAVPKADWPVDSKGNRVWQRQGKRWVRTKPWNSRNQQRTLRSYAQLVEAVESLQRDDKAHETGGEWLLTHQFLDRCLDIATLARKLERTILAEPDPKKELAFAQELIDLCNPVTKRK